MFCQVCSVFPGRAIVESFSFDPNQRKEFVEKQASQTSFVHSSFLLQFSFFGSLTFAIVPNNWILIEAIKDVWKASCYGLTLRRRSWRSRRSGLFPKIQNCPISLSLATAIYLLLVHKWCTENWFRTDSLREAVSNSELPPITFIWLPLIL